MPRAYPSTSVKKKKTISSGRGVANVMDVNSKGLAQPG